MNFHPIDRLEAHLINWARWMRKSSRGGYTVSMGVSGSTHFEDMTEEADRVSARIMDTLISDLPPAQTAAINHVYLGVVWRFPRNNLDALLATARESIESRMDEKCLY